MVKLQKKTDLLIGFTLKMAMKNQIMDIINFMTLLILQFKDQVLTNK